MNKIIVYLGPKGSYTEIAAEKFIKLTGIEEYKSEIINSITGVIESTDKNNNIGVVPIENSIEGIVRETVDTLIKTTSRVTIVREILTPIAHYLISKAENMSRIDKIISHPQALAQCNGFIIKNFGNIDLISASSTSEAARQLISLPDNYAAIGTYKASELYGLNILTQEINDEKDNLTRFVCLDSYIPKPTGNMTKPL
ncbi:MAG: hypothetical protein MZV64_27830 [Ignavibacteriales bacterium]|nr:hypothetical protein [Ignavibacteriales bacterium]